MACNPHPRTLRARLAAPLLALLTVLALTAGGSFAGAQADLPNKLFLPLVTQQAERRLLVQQPMPEPGTGMRLVSVYESGQDVREIVPPSYPGYGYAIWSPDGSKIAYSGFDSVASDDRRILTVINADGSGKRRLSDPAVGVMNFCWAPDGTALFFTAELGSWTSQIYRVNVDGSGLEAMSDPISDNMFFTAQFAPDCGTIAYARSSLEGYHIYLMNLDGSGIRRLTSGTDLETDIYWSPDSSRIAFAAKLTGSEHPPVLGIARVDDGSLIVVAVDHRPSVNIPPFVAWAPDGDRLAVTVDRRSGGAGSDIVLAVVNSDGTGLTYLEQRAYMPAWSPDGDRIAFSDLMNVYVIRPDGGGVREVIAGWSPKWQPLPTDR
jgi:Tol biopolymer transport system component